MYNGQEAETAWQKKIGLEACPSFSPAHKSPSFFFFKSFSWRRNVPEGETGVCVYMPEKGLSA